MKGSDLLERTLRRKGDNLGLRRYNDGLEYLLGMNTDPHRIPFERKSKSYWVMADEMLTVISEVLNE